MRPLYDITIYYNLTGPEPKDPELQKKANYICDFYHKMLMGYKPPKTTRICIHISEKYELGDVSYFGSICTISNVMDRDKYLAFDQINRYKYLLSIVHQTCLTLAKLYKWEIAVFENAYKSITEMRFQFKLDYPIKKAKNKKFIGQVQIQKTEDRTILNLLLTVDNKIRVVKLFEKKNWFWGDSAYKLATHSKWLDNSTFGICSNDNTKFGYFSLTNDRIIGNLQFNDTDF